MSSNKRKKIKKEPESLLEDLEKQYGRKQAIRMLAKMSGYEDVPPTINEFLDDPYYLGETLLNDDGTSTIFPTWREALNEIYPNPFFSPYLEICLTGDTKVDLLDGRTLTMEEIVKEFQDKQFEVLSYDVDKKRYVVGRAHHPMLTHRSAEVYEVLLDNGESFKATKNHKFLKRDNTFVKIEDMKVGDSLKSANLYNRHGYLEVWDEETQGYQFLHRLVVKSVNDNLKDSEVVHHKNRDVFDNRTENLEIMSRSKHQSLHSKDQDRIEHIRRLGKLAWSDPVRIEHFRKKQKEFMLTEKGRELSRRNIINWNSFVKSLSKDHPVKVKMAKRAKIFCKKRWSDPRQREEASIRQKKEMLSGKAKYMSDKQWNNPDTYEEKREWARDKFTRIKSKVGGEVEFQKRARKAKCLSSMNRVLVNLGKVPDLNSYDQEIRELNLKYKPTLFGISKCFGSLTEDWKIDIYALSKIWEGIWESARNYNHRVLGIKYVGKQPVYNMQVDDQHNYRLSCGVLTTNCLTGSIGQGKSTIAKIGAVYDICRILHLKEPHSYFGVGRGKKIVFAFVNATLKLGKDVLMDEIQSWFTSSSYFREQMTKAPKSCLFPKGVDVTSGSRGSHVLGSDVVSAVLSELNFQDKIANQAYDNYTGAKRRLQSRFLPTFKKRGFYPGRLWLDSSKKDDTSFLDKHIQDAWKDPLTRVYDYSIWDIHAFKGIYSGETFKVFVGSKSRDPFVVTQEYLISGVDPSLIIDVPEEYRIDFDQDIFNALRDLAGKGTWSAYTFLPSIEKIQNCLKHQNPVSKEKIQVDFFDQEQRLISYIDVKSFVNDSRPRFIHIDIGYKHDRTGIGCTRLDGYRTIERFDTLTGKYNRTKDPIFNTEFAMALEPKPGSEIPIYKLKDLIVDLRNAGIPIVLISTDGFQSVNLRQDLVLQGFNVELVSVDRKKDPYETLKNAILEERWKGPAHSLLEEELSKLVDIGDKIDHPRGGSKDLADGVAGSLWAAYLGIDKYNANFTVSEFIEALEEHTEPQNAYDLISDLARGGKSLF